MIATSFFLIEMLALCHTLRRAVQAAAAGGVHAWMSPARGAGHSKWSVAGHFLAFFFSFFFFFFSPLPHALCLFCGRANIKHAKSLQDQKRSATFLKILREIKTAVRVGGTNLDSNHRLATAVQNARQVTCVPQKKQKQNHTSG